MTKMSIIAQKSHSEGTHSAHIRFDDTNQEILVAPPDVLPTHPPPKTRPEQTPKSDKCKRDGVMRFNISGRPFIIPRKSLQLHPKTKLGVLSMQDEKKARFSCDFYIEETGEYYFQRSPRIFEHVLEYYRHGQFHIPDVCPEEFLTEMTFWRLNRDAVAECCRDQIPDILWPKFGKLQRQPHRSWKPNTTGKLLRKRIWDMLDTPWKTKQAKIFSCVGIFFIILIILTIMLHSYPQFTYPEEVPTAPPLPDNTTANTTHDRRTSEHDRRQREFARYTSVISALYCICAVWFTAEYLIRVYAAPNRVRFLKSPMAILDLICIILFYVDVILYIAAKEDLISHKSFSFLQVTQVLQIFRLIRYSPTFQFLGIAIWRTYQEILILIMTVFVLTLFFGVILSIVEKPYNHKIDNILDAMYFTFITITTVGYGDISPSTPAGRVVTVVAAFAGVVILAFPISLIVSEFSRIYEVERQKKRHNEDDRGLGDDQNASLRASYQSFQGKSSIYGARPTHGSESGVDIGRPSICLHRQPSHKPRRSHMAGMLGRMPYIIRSTSESADQYATVNVGNRRMSTDAINALYRRLSVSDMHRAHYDHNDDSKSFSSSYTDSNVFEEVDEEDDITSQGEEKF